MSDTPPSPEPQPSLEPQPKQAAQPGRAAQPSSAAQPKLAKQPSADAQPSPIMQPSPVTQTGLDAQPKPVACCLGAGDLADRVARWKAVAARAAGERLTTEHGVRLSFTATPGVADELRDLAALEADCCSFATWTVHETVGHVVVDVTGDSPTGATVIQDMFATLGAPQ
jgi:hypothetical protein